MIGGKVFNKFNPFDPPGGWSPHSILSRWETSEDFERAKLDMHVFGVGYAAFHFGPNGATLHHIPAETVALLQNRWRNELRDYAESG